mmetsp:Transcript_18069/g.43143  ORF Transcript_18069/g.43143 Transcript_18069/m.43143 type:complete len:678 (+) Transcript_18069:676-2709(+)
MLLGFEAEACDPVLRVAHADGVQHPDRHHVFRLRQRRAQRHRAFELAVIVLRLPGLAAGRAGIEEQGGVVHDRGRREALFQCGRVDERLEARTRLSPGLGDVVELVLVVVKAADQRVDLAGARVHGHKGALDLGQLRDGPLVAVLLLGALDDADHGTAADAGLRVALVRQARGGGLEAVAGDGDGLATLQHGRDLLRVGLDHDRRQQLVVGRMIGQRFGDAGVQFPGIAGQVGIGLGATVDLALLIVEDAAAQRTVGRVLLGAVQRQVDVEPAGVGFVAVLAEDQLARGLGHEFGMRDRFVDRPDAQLFGLGFVTLFLGDVASLVHPLDDVLLADGGAPRVVDRVVGRGRLGQAGQHRGLGDAELVQRLAEIDLAGCCEAMRPVTEEDLVHVDLEDLLLAQVLLDLDREQRLLGLAPQGLAVAQVDVAGQLLGDGGRALQPVRVQQVVDEGAQDAAEVDARVAVEIAVLDGEQRVLQRFRDVLERHEATPLGTELADQLAVLTQHAQRLVGLVVGQRVELGQLGPDESGDDAAAQQQHQRQGHQRTQPGPLNKELEHGAHRRPGPASARCRRPLRSGGRLGHGAADGKMAACRPRRSAMKIHQIEIQKFKAATNNLHGQVLFKIDALVSAREPVDGIEPSSLLVMTEQNARVLMALLKTQIAEFDAKKPKSRHGRHG